MAPSKSENPGFKPFIIATLDGLTRENCQKSPVISHFLGVPLNGTLQSSFSFLFQLSAAGPKAPRQKMAVRKSKNSGFKPFIIATLDGLAAD